MSPNFKILIGEVLQKIEFKVSIDQIKLSTLPTVIKFRSKKKHVTVFKPKLENFTHWRPFILK